jgi:SAM-dependent methyltransferase
MTYVLERNQEEYERLCAQARMWEPATARLLDRIGLGPGTTCLDVGCGPGEAMRLMAERGGQVTGIDVDPGVGAYAIERLHAAGHQATFEAVDVGDYAGGTFDLVFARLLLLHVDDHAATLRRLWEWVAPGGHLVLMEHDMGNVGVVPPLESTDGFFRVVLETFTRGGSDIEIGRKLPLLHEQAGVGPVDGVDVLGRLESLSVDGEMYEAIFRSMLPAAVELGVTTRARGERWFGEFARDVARHGERRAVWPLMIGTWRRE